MSRRLFITGGRQPRECVLVGTFIVGRDPNCDLSEQDPLLSRRHAEFVEDKNGVVVRDLNSRNGILVNGLKSPRAVLRDGDVVQVGSLQVKFLESAGPDQIAVPSPAPPDEADVPTVTQSLVPTVVLPPVAADADTIAPFAKTAAGDAGTMALDLQQFVAPGGRFRFEMPALGWQLISGGSVSLLTLAYEGGGAAIVVERVPRDLSMSTIVSSEIFVGSERDIVRNQQPEASVLDAGVATLAGRRLVIVNYSRPGVRGPERARQYSYAEGTGVYRLTCSAVASRFAQFEPVFAQLAATFEIESLS